MSVHYLHQLEPDGTLNRDPPEKSWLRAVFGEMAFTKVCYLFIDGNADSGALVQVVDIGELNLGRFGNLQSLAVMSDSIQSLNGIEQLRIKDFLICSTSLTDLSALSDSPIENLEIIDCPSIEVGELDFLGHMKSPLSLIHI